MSGGGSEGGGALLERLPIEHPVVQAGMGGGIATGTLAGTVSAAGGLGTVGILPPRELLAELRLARERSGGAPVAANLLVPFATRGHVASCLEGGAAAVVIHGGIKRALVERLSGRGALVLQTVGTPDEARRALAAGAQGLVVQGREAGGHLVGVEPALAALHRVLAIARQGPVLVAGGISSTEDARRALAGGAHGVVAGTRFLLTEESGAHPEYKRRVLAAERTLETELFGLGWPLRHRVVPNAATDRWCRAGDSPAALRAVHRLSAPLARVPPSLVSRSVGLQRPALPLFGPVAPVAGMDERLVDATALYAGETALRIESLLPAREAVGLLARGLSA